MTGIDVIGDVHGMIATYHELLARLGYTKDGATWSHPRGRRIVQLGDLVDRGPDPLGCVELTAELAGSGIAAHILGNHEVNALGWFEGARAHTDGNRRQFSATLHQIEADPARWDRCASFLRTQPLSLESDGFRFVHAAWVPEAVAALPRNLSDVVDLRETGRGGRHHFAIEQALKGPEEEVDRPFIDQHGVARRRRRIRWWESYPADAPIVCFGHYWFFGTPRMLAPAGNAICLDYSCGRGGPLVAWRWPECSFISVRNRDIAAMMLRDV